MAVESGIVSSADSIISTGAPLSAPQRAASAPLRQFVARSRLETGPIGSVRMHERSVGSW